MAVLERTAKKGNVVVVGAPPRGCPLVPTKEGKGAFVGAYGHTPISSNLGGTSLSAPNLVVAPSHGDWFFSTFAQDFLFAGTSALFLLIANLFPAYWYLSFLALIPFLYKTIKATPPAALRLGFLFGLAFFSVSMADSLLSSPFSAVLKLASGTVLFALFGWMVGKAKEKFGFNPIAVALLWVIFELALVKINLFANNVGAIRESPTPYFHGLAILFGFLAVSFVIVLVNSLLIFAIEKTLALGKAKREEFGEAENVWEPNPIPGLFAQKVYLVPQGRAPPVFSF